MEEIFQSIESALKEKNWYSALILSLIVPDICAKLEGGHAHSSKRYPAWFDKYLKSEYDTFLSGDDCYALRCSYLHEGIDDIQKQKARKNLSHIKFLHEGSHKCYIGSIVGGDKKYEGAPTLILSVNPFCIDIVNAGRQWLSDVSSNPKVLEEMKNTLKVYTHGLQIGGLNLI
jgi:hypothetical protein